MKNFRKTIIALATVAAMLVPSVAMAATLTTTVDKDITGDVYVGFYDGAVLKDVVKTTVDDITVSEAETAGTEETLPATVTITDVATGQMAADAPDVEVRKLVFTAQAPNRLMTAFGILLSYDNTKVVTIAPGDLTDMSFSWWDDNDDTCRPYTLCTGAPFKNAKGQIKTCDLSAAPSLYTTIGNRDAMNLSQYTTNKIMLDDELVLCEVYYRVLDGQTVDKDTFKIETEVGADTFNAEIGSDGSEYGISLESPDAAGAMKYAGWNNGTAIADTIKLVTPWDVQESTTKDLTVTVPAGAEDYTATMFIWDENQIAQCAPITTWN